MQHISRSTFIVDAAEARFVLGDLFTLPKRGLPPDVRFSLKRKDTAGLLYWVLEP